MSNQTLIPQFATTMKIRIILLFLEILQIRYML